VIYIRQSTLMQVREHTESTARQYGLAAEAARLGWAGSDVEVIDADLGRGGLCSTCAHRVPRRCGGRSARSAMSSTAGCRGTCGWSISVTPRTCRRWPGWPATMCASANWRFGPAGCTRRGSRAGLVGTPPCRRASAGGPQTPGVLVVRRDLVRNRVPTAPGGGTVAFVDPIGHRYLDDPAAREEGGTPAIVESIRAGLVFALKQAVGTDLIQAREERLWRRALHRWQANPRLEILGNRHARRLSVVSFRIRHGSRYLHHNFVVAVLNDLFGIQSRGGCSCAGPYGHRLLAIDAARSHAYRDEVVRGCDGIKPGWVRVNFNYFITDTVRDYLIDAVDLVATHGHRLLTDYRFDPHTALWHHHAGSAEPPLRLRDVRFDADGRLTYPQHRTQAGEEALAGYVRQARALLATKADQVEDGPTGLPDDFEALRWFHLPPASLTGPPSDPSTARAARPAAV
jgi:hypothetical protein